MQRGVLHTNMYDHRNRRVAHPVALERVGGASFGALQQLEARAHAALGVIEQRIHRVAQYVGSKPRVQRLPSRAPRRTRRPLGAQIPFTLFGCAHIGEHESHHIVLRHPAALDTHRRHDEAFLKQLGGAKRHATGTHPAHVGMMRPHRGVPNDALGIVRVGDHLDHREVGQMRAPVRRVVEQEHVTRRGATGTDRRDRFWHGTKVYRNVRRLRHHATIGIE